VALVAELPGQLLGRWTVSESPETLRVLVSGYHSWSEAELQPLLSVQPRPLLWSRVQQAHDPEFPPSGEAGVWRSHTMTALVRPDGGGWVGTASDARRSFVRWQTEAVPGGVMVQAWADGEGDVTADWQAVPDVAAALERGAAALGIRMGARHGAPLRVWCSWYAYGQRVTAQALLNEARAIREAALPIEVFQIDDGFQAEVGDWFELRPRFGLPLPALARELRALDFTPGLWLAPLLVSPNSRLARQHPEWLLADERAQPALYGDNWGGPYHALDASRTDVLAWLERLGAAAREWDYPYLKLDFLFAGALPGVRSDPQVTRAGSYRDAIEALRAGAGPDAYLLGCGAPLAASVGVMDAMRTGPDVAPRWDDALRRTTLRDRSGPATRNAVQTCLARWYLRHWYTPDPDPVLVRRVQSLLTGEQRAVLAGLLDTVGGVRSFSDPMKLLDEAALAELRQVLEPSAPDQALLLDLQHSGGTVSRFRRRIYEHLDFPNSDFAPLTRPTATLEEFR
jgi:alpha-galactosidase